MALIDDIGLIIQCVSYLSLSQSIEIFNLNIHNIHLSWRSRGWQTWRSWLLMSECGSDCGSLSNITHHWIESAQLPRHWLCAPPAPHTTPGSPVLPTSPHGSTHSRRRVRKIRRRQSTGVVIDQRTFLTCH